MVRFGVQFPSFSYGGKGRDIFTVVKAKVRLAEQLGFDSVWVMDHFYQVPGLGAPEEPMLEGWTTVSALSQVTDRIKIGTLVTGNIYRNPAILAKMGATVDVISGGRLNMGIGAGWYETEALAYGIPYYTAAERLGRLAEALQIIHGLWTAGKFTLSGKYYQVIDALCEPKPIQRPHPPIWVGGNGERITLRLVAEYGNACNLFGDLTEMKHKLQVLFDHCKEVKTSYERILKTCLGLVVIGERESEVRTLMARYQKAGFAEEAYVASIIHGTPDRVAERIQEYADAGIQYFVLNFDFREEERDMQLFADKVMPQFIR